MRSLVWLVMSLALFGCSAEQQSAENLGSVTQCDPLGQECVFDGGSRSVGLELPSVVKPLTRFPVQVSLAGVRAQRVTVEFTMEGMDMGVNRFALREQDGRWLGEGILPVCTTGRSDWRATVSVTPEQGRTLQALFLFHTEK